MRMSIAFRPRYTDTFFLLPVLFEDPADDDTKDKHGRHDDVESGLGEREPERPATHGFVV
jgi:hypothetical protein